MKAATSPADKLIRRKVFFGAFQLASVLDEAPLFLSAQELIALERDGAVIASDGYEYQVLRGDASAREVQR